MNKRSKREKRYLLLREKFIREARKSFWTFCRLLEPEFYKKDRKYLKQMCYILQALYEGRIKNKNGKAYKRLMLNIPPRFGKSRTMVLFSMWVLGKNNTNKIIECSYSDEAAVEFSRFTRDGIDKSKNYEWEVVYSDVFPDTKTKRGDASVSKWSLEGQFFNYIGAGLGGAITGKGCNIAIVDDPIKSEEIANNEAALDKIWKWYTGTYLSRIEEGGIQIIVMTRWATKDLCGRLLKKEPGKWYRFSLEAYDGVNMLCDEVLSLETYEEKRAVMDTGIFQANYHQKPVDIKSRLYQNIKIYDSLPLDSSGQPAADRIWARVDTADEGSDYLCSITGVEYKKIFYVTDVLYTQDAQETTEPETADQFIRNGVREGIIESNNGGRAFARNVERILKEKGHNEIIVRWFYQSQNKISRIRTNAASVQNNIAFPADWKIRWPKFYSDVINYQRDGKNAHDDAPDTLTGIIEEMLKPSASPDAVDSGGKEVEYNV